MILPFDSANDKSIYTPIDLVEAIAFSEFKSSLVGDALVEDAEGTEKIYVGKNVMIFVAWSDLLKKLKSSVSDVQIYMTQSRFFHYSYLYQKKDHRIMTAVEELAIIKRIVEFDEMIKRTCAICKSSSPINAADQNDIDYHVKLHHFGGTILPICEDCAHEEGISKQIMQSLIRAQEAVEKSKQDADKTGTWLDKY